MKPQDIRLLIERERLDVQNTPVAQAALVQARADLRALEAANGTVFDDENALWQHNAQIDRLERTIKNLTEELQDIGQRRRVFQDKIARVLPRGTWVKLSVGDDTVHIGRRVTTRTVDGKDIEEESIESIENHDEADPLPNLRGPA